jgi:hypothetical protein
VVVLIPTIVTKPLPRSLITSMLAIRSHRYRLHATLARIAASQRRSGEAYRAEDEEEGCEYGGYTCASAERTFESVLNRHNNSESLTQRSFCKRMICFSPCMCGKVPELFLHVSSSTAKGARVTELHMHLSPLSQNERCLFLERQRPLFHAHEFHCL